MNNNDPVSTIGGVSKKADLQLALEGGDEFIARMKQLADAKQQSDTALDSLRLGKDARAAYAEAKAAVTSAVAEAETLRQQAAGELNEAKKTAADILSQANDDARRLVAEAQEVASNARSDAQQAASAIAAQAATTLREAEEALAAAKVKESATTKALASANNTLLDHERACKELDDKKRGAVELKQRLDGYLIKLQAVIAEIAAN